MKITFELDIVKNEGRIVCRGEQRRDGELKWLVRQEDLLMNNSTEPLKKFDPFLGKLLEELVKTITNEFSGNYEN